MEYYIRPDEPETDFLKITSPEDLKVCDPACGSGHMLTYAFDLLYRIYEEQGYAPTDIPKLILEKNLYGVEIDDRAGELAAFALNMKARAKDRRFFNRKVEPNICVLRNVHFDKDEISDYMDFIGRDLFSEPLRQTLTQFEEADNFGSLIQPELQDVANIRQILKAFDVAGQIFLADTHRKVLEVLKQADYLSQKYHVVVANPPYMGGKGMNGRLAAWLKENYKDVKTDLFSAFVVRNCGLCLPNGTLGFMTPFVWMFISSYEKLREFLIKQKTITSLIQLEYSGFDGATVPICTFTLQNKKLIDYKGAFVRLSDFVGPQVQAPKALEAIQNHACGWFYRTNTSDFEKIPGSPIAYWVSETDKKVFGNMKKLNLIGDTRQGMATSDNSRFLRLWYEVSSNKTCFVAGSHIEAEKSMKKWFPYNKGGDFRKWYGNQMYVINWENGGKEVIDYAKLLYKTPSRTIKSYSEYFKECISWSKISSGSLAMRYYPKGFIFDVAGCCIF